MLERREKSTRTKKADSSTAFTKDKEISALYTVLNVTESKEEEWDEFYYLLNARYFLNEVIKENFIEKVGILHFFKDISLCLVFFQYF